MARKSKKVEEVKCCGRCNGKKSKEWFEVKGVTVGIECVDDANKLAEKGLEGEGLKEVLRKGYLEVMRITTVTGMILKGQLDLSEMIANGKITKNQFLEETKRRHYSERGLEIVGKLS